MKPSKPAWTSQTVWMTPELATKLLQKNKINRPLSDYQINKYLGIMTSEEWVPNPQGNCVIIGTDGNILDGQTRLAALVRGSLSMWWVIWEEVDPEARLSMDQLKVRSTGDRMAMKYREPDGRPMERSREYSAICRVIACIEDVTSNPNVSDKRRFALKDKYADEIEWAKVALGFRKGALLIGALCWTRHLAADDELILMSIDDFAHKVRTGLNLSEGDPALWAISIPLKRSAQSDRWWNILRMLRLIEAHIQERPFKQRPPWFRKNAELVIDRLRQSFDPNGAHENAA